jgi:Cu-Zn family superoxide dismutase
MRLATQAFLVAGFLGAGFAAQAQTIQVPMQLVDVRAGTESIGTVTITGTSTGVTLTPALEGLPPGTHGFHVHEKPSCDPAMNEDQGKVVAAQAAGGHLDPVKTGHHEGPSGKGHLGDLPALTVDSNGKATTPVTAARLKLSDLAGHSLMIHAGGDNYSDSPEKLGGGGARIACGVISLSPR